MSGSDSIAASQIEAEKSSSSVSRWGASLPAGLIILAAIAVYHNCFSVPFLLDDFGAIVENPTIRHLWPIRDALSPPHGTGLTVEGRPVVNLSLAVNYAFGGTTLRGYLVLTTGTRGGTAGFQTTVGPWDYALTQAWAMVHYLRLSVWPHPLVFDYGTYLVTTAAPVLPAVLILAVLIAGTAIGLWRRLAIGFLGAWFFLILAPSSSVVPVATQAVAEHRMYLPLMAVVALVVLGMHTLMGRLRMSVFLTLAVGLGFVTLLRIQDYRSARALWSDTVTKLPTNARAHNNLGASLVEEGRVTEAIPCYEQALRLQPDYEDARSNLIALQTTPPATEATK